MKPILLSLFLLSSFVGWGQSHISPSVRVDTIRYDKWDTIHQSYHITTPEFEGVILDDCFGRKSFVPTIDDIFWVESKLELELSSTVIGNSLSRFKRQYHGCIDYQGNKIVYVTGILDSYSFVLDGDWLREKCKLVDDKGIKIWDVTVVLDLNGTMDDIDFEDETYPFLPTFWDIVFPRYSVKESSPFHKNKEVNGPVVRVFDSTIVYPYYILENVYYDKTRRYMYTISIRSYEDSTLNYTDTYNYYFRRRNRERMMEGRDYTVIESIDRDLDDDTFEEGWRRERRERRRIGEVYGEYVEQSNSFNSPLEFIEPYLGIVGSFESIGIDSSPELSEYDSKGNWTMLKLEYGVIHNLQYTSLTKYREIFYCE
jgi:hypothetical protein